MAQTTTPKFLLETIGTWAWQVVRQCILLATYFLFVIRCATLLYNMYYAYYIMYYIMYYTLDIA